MWRVFDDARDRMLGADEVGAQIRPLDVLIYLEQMEARMRRLGEIAQKRERASS